MVKENINIFTILFDIVTHYLVSEKYSYWIAQNRVWIIVFISTVNNISVISWRSVLLVEETGVHGENHRTAVSHIMFIEYTSPERYSNSQR